MEQKPLLVVFRHLHPLGKSLSMVSEVFPRSSFGRSFFEQPIE
jgi:hypothetical protein